METKTYFIEDLALNLELSLGESSYQSFEGISIKSTSYSDVILSGCLFKEVVFENVTFYNCTFFSTHFKDCLFIHCTFVNCKFKFSRFTGCNFELTQWKNCTWGLCTIKDSDLQIAQSSGNVAFESVGTGVHTTLLSNWSEFLSLSA